MKLRIRLVGALVALLALTLYFAEGVLASACPPQMHTDGVEEVEQDATERSCAIEMKDASSDESESPEQPRSDSPMCPLGPIGVSGSCAAASLPAPTSEVALSIPEGAPLSPAPDAAWDLLLAAALFHPPKA